VFDLNLFPLYIKNSNEQNFLPGLRFQAAPKNANRNRSGDYLLILVTPFGENSLAEDRIQLILEKSLREYFQSSGTVTSGIKKIAEIINEAVLEYNLKDSPGGQQVTVLLNCAVIHGERVYIGHSGYTHSFVLNKETTEHHYDPEGSGRGLGVSRTVTLRFFLGDIKADEYILFSPEPLATWTPANLSGSPSIALDYLKRRLLNQVSPNVRALLIQVKPGSGRIILQSPLSNSTVIAGQPLRQMNPVPPVQVNLEGKAIPVMAISARAKDANKVVEPVIGTRNEALEPTRALPVQILSSASPGVPAKPIPQVKPDIQIEESELSYREALLELKHDIGQSSKRLQSGLSTFFLKFKKEKKPPHPDAEIRFKKVNTEKFDRLITSTGKAASKTAGTTGKILKTAAVKTGKSFNQALEYITPEGGFKLPSLPNPVMILISIAIPLIVVVAASSMYLTRGKTSQFDYYLNQAKTTIAQIGKNQTPAEQRKSWENAVVLLDKAEKYGKSDEAITLRSQAQNVLDDLGGIARIEFIPAIVDGLPPASNITQIVSTSTDIYMLDGVSGQVLRAILTGKGFEMDPTFSCAPGPFGSYIVDPFVDITLVPKGNSLDASLVALDGRGNIVYCGPGVMATSMTLTPPDSGWGKVKAITLDGSRLYVMDIESNSIWVYMGGIGAFINKPYNFFDIGNPPMQDALDFSVNGNDLYMLHQDGHMTSCLYSDILGSPTKCKDPIPYVITVNGGEKKPVVVPNTTFTHLQYSQPPDPSIYLLDATGQSLYHFSLRMTLQKKLSMQTGDPFKLNGKTATAFSVNPGKVMFIAFGNKIYQGIEP
jgi:hypothetical protein